MEGCEGSIMLIEGLDEEHTYRRFLVYPLEEDLDRRCLQSG